jgi:hypothetical protein
MTKTNEPHHPPPCNDSAKLRNAATLSSIVAGRFHALADQVELGELAQPSTLARVVQRAKVALPIAREALDDIESEMEARWPAGHEPAGGQ